MYKYSKEKLLKVRSHYFNTPRHDADVIMIIDELIEIKEKQHQGLFLELPCKVGDTIFVIPSKVNYRLNVCNGYTKHNKVHIQTVSEVRFFKNAYLLTTFDGLLTFHSEFYKVNWFLTQEQAEKALEALNANT